MHMKRLVILHNIRSAHNVGSVFRTADGAGVSKLYLTGCTPAPIDRFGRMQPQVAKTSLGASETVAWEQYDSIATCMKKLKEDGVAIVVVEQLPHAVDYRTYTQNGDVAFLFGNEVDGVSEDIAKHADSIIAIPMHGKKESLNVSVAAGIVLFAVCSPL